LETVLGRREGGKRQGYGNPDAAALTKKDHDCVGAAPNGYAFGSHDKDVLKTLGTIARQNRETDRIHPETPSRHVYSKHGIAPDGARELPTPP